MRVGRFDRWGRRRRTDGVGTAILPASRSEARRGGPGDAVGVSLRKNDDGIPRKAECVLRVVGRLVVAAGANNLCRNPIEREEVQRALGRCSG